MNKDCEIRNGSGNAVNNNERSNVNITHMSTSSYNVLLAIVVFVVFFLTLAGVAISAYMTYSNKVYLEERLNDQDQTIIEFLSKGRP